MRGMAPVEPAPLPAPLAHSTFRLTDLTAAGFSAERARRADLRSVTHGVHRATGAAVEDWRALGHDEDPVPWPPEEAADDVVEIHGIRTTSVERAWLDLAALRPRGPRDPLVIAGDARVNRPWADGQRSDPVTTPERLREALRRTGRFKGVRLAREALHLVRVGADPPPETELRLALIEAGLPEPELQVPGDPQDRFAPIVDLGYRAWRLALQYDGEHHRSREQQARDARRDGWLQDHGWRSLRLTADDRLTGFARAIEWVRRHRS